jgi:hypothetical protein
MLVATHSLKKLLEKFSLCMCKTSSIVYKAKGKNKQTESNQKVHQQGNGQKIVEH